LAVLLNFSLPLPGGYLFTHPQPRYYPLLTKIYPQTNKFTALIYHLIILPNMKNTVTLLLRLALGIAFISAVADRLGYWGKPGDAGVAWGNWDNFVAYTATLNFGAPKPLANLLGIIGTTAEVILGLLLIIGYKLKYTATLSGVLLLIFALLMCINTHVKGALDYSVFTASFAAFLLAQQPAGKWSIDGAGGSRA
jgi:putative oxidoreductase